MKISSGGLLLRLIVPHLLLAAAAHSQPGTLTPEEISARLLRFTPAILVGDTTGLAAADRTALRHLIEAGKILDGVYLRQCIPGGDTLPAALAADGSPEGALRRRYFLLNASPWSAFDLNRAIIPRVPDRKPPQANLYPTDMVRGDWGSWFISLDSYGQAKATSPYYVVRFDSNRRFTTVPYSAEYGDLLDRAGERLKLAASEATDEGLRRYLLAVEGAFRTDDYGACDQAGMKAGGPLLAVLGPTNPYLDNMFRYKMAYEVVVGTRNRQAAEIIHTMEKGLAGVLKELGTGTSPARRVEVRVDDAAYIGGAARSGTLPPALLLPADPRVAEGTGSRIVILRNVQEAKFETNQRPIARLMLDSADAGRVGFDAYLAHLMMQGLLLRYEPADPWKGNGEAEPSLREDAASALRDVRTATAALIGIESLVGRGALRDPAADRLYATRLSTLLLALRYLGSDPASRAAAIEFNYLRERGGLIHDATRNIVRIDLPKFRAAVRALHKAVADLQSAGNPDGASDFITRYAIQPTGLLGLRERLSSLPLDIEPSFPMAE